MPRLIDLEAGLATAAAWALIAHLANGYDAAFLLTFFLTGFFLFMISALTGRRWMGLITAFAAGLLSLHSASVVGPGVYKLILFTGAGLVFEAFYSFKEEGFPLLGAALAATSMPLFMWVLANMRTELLQALMNLTMVAIIGGLGGAAAALLIWWKIGHTKAVIRFQCYGGAAITTPLKKAAKRGKRF